VSGDRSGDRAVALPLLRPRPRLGPRQLQGGLSGSRAGSARDSRLRGQRRIHVLAGSCMVPRGRVLLSGLRHDDRGRIPSAGPSSYSRHRARHRRVEAEERSVRTLMKRTTIDIDIGGTFTDCYITHGDKQIWCKARTTGYGLSVCTLQAIEEGAARLDIDIKRLLAETD